MSGPSSESLLKELQYSIKQVQKENKMKKKMSKEKMNYLKNFSSYIALCHITLGMFSNEVFAVQGTLGANPPIPVVDGTIATGIGAKDPAVIATDKSSDSAAPGTTDQQFAQAQIAAQNLKALIAQQQSSTGSGGVIASGNATPGIISTTGATATDSSGTVSSTGSIVSTDIAAGVVASSVSPVVGTAGAAGSVGTIAGSTDVASTIGGTSSGPGMVITAGGSGSATSLVGTPMVVTAGGANPSISMDGTSPMTISADGSAGVTGVPGMVTQGGMVAGSGGLMPAPMPMTLTDSGAFEQKRASHKMSSYINSKVQDFILEETIKGVLNAMEEMSDSPYNMRTIGSVVKALDNPARARQEILMRSLMINQPNIVNVAVDKLIGDYAPGNISEDQRNAVLSAARVAMEYGRQYGKLGALSFMTRDLNDLGSSDGKTVDTKGKPISKSEQDVGMSLTNVDGQTCMVDPQILGKLPAGCNIYTVNFYGQDGVNNFYKVNINGNMVAASNKPLKVPGSVKWSITYGCSQNTVAPITTPAAGAVTPGSTALATPATNTVTTTNVATVGGFSCDAQKGLLLPSGNGITNFSNNNGVLTVS
ncbi:MAG: hypothetical protein C0432_03765 [Candidatus Puniceispirillum sp.]|nr:hypothetical protein [Candidatus Pelagibacter sp.]MBA4283392.1 hypothetical protein [Candidatus Puniceispirillum sp.]